MMGIRVVSVEGQPITPFQAILRNILRDVDAQPLWFIPSGRSEYRYALSGGTRRHAQRSLPTAGRSGGRARWSWSRSDAPARRCADRRAGGDPHRRVDPADVSSRAARWPARWRPTCNAASFFPGAGDWRSPGTSASRCGRSSSFRPARISTCCFAACIAARSSPTAPTRSTSRRKAIRRSGNRPVQSPNSRRATVVGESLETSEAKEQKTNHGDTENAERVVKMSPPSVWERGWGMRTRWAKRAKPQPNKPLAASQRRTTGVNFLNNALGYSQ